MTIETTPIQDLLIINPTVFEDARGYFFEAYNQNTLANQGITINFVQDNQSFSKRGTLRGLHYQNPPFAQTKLVRVLQGEREMAKDNWELGKFDVAFSPSPKGQARVGVQFRIDENGILEVLARDVGKNWNWNRHGTSHDGFASTTPDLALAGHAAALADALAQVAQTTRAAWSGANPTAALANAVPYMQAFGHTVLAWLWLEVALAALRRDAMQTIAFTQGKTGAAAYFYHYELPKITAWLNVVRTHDLTCVNLNEEAF